MRTSFAILALSAIASVSAQRKVFSNTDINVGAVPLNTRAGWCQGERNTCQILCDGTTANNCDPNTLTYACTCKNGTAPGLEYYDQTLPSFICIRAFEDCITANVGDARGQSNCTDTIRSQCGTIDPQAEFAATTSTSAATTPTGGAANTNTGGASQATQTPASSSSTAYAAPTAVPARYGNAAAVAAIGLFAYMI